MKKIKLLSLLGLSLTLISGCLSFNNSNIAKAEDEREQVETTLGPGYVNPIAGEYDPENPTKDNYSLAYRAGWLMMFPDCDMYKGVAYKAQLSAANLVKTDLKMVKIYYDENNYFTLSDVVAKGYDATAFNQFNDLVLNVSFNIKALKGNSFEAYSVYKVVIEKGFVYPYATAADEVDHVQKSTYTLRNINYNDGTTKDIYYSGGWEPIKTLDGGEEKHIVAVGARTELQYRVHIRDGGIPDGSKAGDDEQTGNCWLILHFPTGTYNPEAPGSTFLSQTYLGYYNFLDKIHLTLTGTETSLTMREVTAGKDKYAYTLWGERNSIAFYIGTGKPDDANNYHGKSFSKITVEAGCEFPSFQSTHGTTTKLIKYVQSSTISLLRDGGKAAWALNWEHGFSYGDTNITEVKAFEDSRIYKEKQIAATYISLKLDNSNYQGCEPSIVGAYSDYLLRNTYVNGKSLNTINFNKETYVWINLVEENTLSISVDGLRANEINEIIVKGKTEIPAYALDYSSAALYGSVGYYGTVKSVSYTKNGDTFTLDNRICWSLWFDDKCERVYNMDYFNFDEAPKGVTNDRQTFLYWVDVDGIKLEGYLRITSSENFYGRYLYYYYLTIEVDGKTSSKKVDSKSRIYDALDNPSPTKDGYIFKGWVNGKGEDINIDNLVTCDQTVKANFVKDPSQKDSGGCASSIIATSGIISILSILGVSLISLKKKEGN